MPKRELFDVACRFLRSTDKAICVTEDDGKTEIWLPISQIEYELKQSGACEVTMPVWLAREKGFAGA